MAVLYAACYDPPPPDGFRMVDQATRGRIVAVPDWALPGTGAAKPTTAAVRFRVYPGEVTNPTTNPTSRAELSTRVATGWNTPPEAWPDPVGAVRWYDWALLIPDGFTCATDTTWLTITQWKGVKGGPPPVAVEVKRGDLRFVAGPIARDLGPIVPGTWTRLTVGMLLANDLTGWVHVYRDGIERVARTNVPTMDTVDGAPDPTYLKQGIYRSSRWTCPHEVWHGPILITDEQPTP